MCLLTIATGACRRFPIIILNNRDEYVTRSTSRLALFGANGVPQPPTSSPTSPSSSSIPNAFPIGSPSPSSSTASSSAASNKLANLLCAIDTSIPNGGTWMGVNVQTGAFASVTNSPQCASQILHLPSLAPNRIELSAASSSFDWAGYVAKVIGESSLSKTTPATSESQANGADGSESGCCGLRVTNGNGDKNNAGISFARPFLKFAPEKSRGFIVGEYLSESRWESSDIDSRVPHDGSTDGRRWLPCIPSNVVVPQKNTGLKGERSPAHVLDRDLYYDGYNLVCGNLIEIAESLKVQTKETAETARVGDTGHFLYTTNRQHPFPLSRRGLEGDRKKAPAYSASWCSQGESPQSMLDAENYNVLQQQPSMYLGGRWVESNGAQDSAVGVESASQLSVNTVGNTFIDNPIEPKSKHLTFSVRSALERLFPFSTSDATSSSEFRNSSDFVSKTLVPTLAECLCERPQLEIDLSEPDGKHLGLLAIKPMAGLSEEEYVGALRDRLSKRLGELATEQASKLSALDANAVGALGYDVGNFVSTLSDPERKKVVVDALLLDISSSRESMISRVAEEEREVHRNVYTHLCRGAVIAGTFKTRTQTIAILEDLNEGPDTAGERSLGARRYRLHYYLRDTNTHEDHAPWQVRVVDLPDPLALANQTLN